MLSTAAVGAIGELAALAVISGGLYLFLRDPPAPPSSVPKSRTTGAIIGLTATTDEPPEQPTGPPPTVVKPIPNLDTVGRSIDQHLSVKDPRATGLPRSAEDELSWAAATLSDLPGYGATVIVDKLGNVRWAEGPLLGNIEDCEDAIRSVVRRGNEVVVLDGKAPPFLSDAARCLAVVPVGKDGAAVLVASTDVDFFGPVEKRTAVAVSARLAFTVAAMEQVLALKRE